MIPQNCARKQTKARLICFMHVIYVIGRYQYSPPICQVTASIPLQAKGESEGVGIGGGSRGT